VLVKVLDVCDALAKVAHLKAHKAMPESEIAWGLNERLPADIHVLAVEKAPPPLPRAARREESDVPVLDLAPPGRPGDPLSDHRLALLLEDGPAAGRDPQTLSPSAPGHDLETGAGKVAVEREGARQSMSAHQHERDGIREAETLVGKLDRGRTRRNPTMSSSRPSLSSRVDWD
jgi:hypothetical protein